MLLEEEIVSDSALHPQNLALCLAQSEHSVNTHWTNEWAKCKEHKGLPTQAGHMTKEHGSPRWHSRSQRLLWLPSLTRVPSRYQCQEPRLSELLSLTSCIIYLLQYYLSVLTQNNILTVWPWTSHLSILGFICFLLPTHPKTEGCSDILLRPQTS